MKKKKKRKGTQKKNVETKLRYCCLFEDPEKNEKY